MHVHTCKINGGKDLIRDYLDELSLADYISCMLARSKKAKRNKRI